ncbi:ATP-binding protein [Streptomyces sp. NPDC097619]|uniref:ATP-binding protein n=1 Tax=Streptomyces sp. NPDC097619 TaxID=3157228 RepID=UPI00331DE1FB
MGGSGSRDGTSAVPGAGVSCGQARERARELLERLRVEPQRAGDILTVVGELTSNAHRHAGGVTGFSITAPVPGTVLVEVSDASPKPPEAQPWAPSEPGGFGWMLVNRLAEVTIRPTDGGKTIAATLTTGPREEADSALGSFELGSVEPGAVAVDGAELGGAGAGLGGGASGTADGS